MRNEVVLWFNVHPEFLVLRTRLEARRATQRLKTDQILKNSLTMQFLDSSMHEIDRTPRSIVDPFSKANFVSLTFWGTLGVAFEMWPTVLIHAPADARYEIGKAFDRSTNSFERGMLGLGYAYTVVAQVGMFATGEMAFAGIQMGFMPANGARLATTAHEVQLAAEFRAAGFDFEVVGTRLANAERAAFELKATGYADPKLTQLENYLELIKGEKTLSQRVIVQTPHPPLSSVPKFPNGIDALEGIRLADSIRRSLNIEGRNIALAEIAIEGQELQRLVGVSGSASPIGTVPSPITRLFTTRKTRGAIPTEFDSEVKILEKVAQGLSHDSKGTISLFTERKPCPSCEDVIKQFKQMFPDIKVIVTNGKRGGR